MVLGPILDREGVDNANRVWTLEHDHRRGSRDVYLGFIVDRVADKSREFAIIDREVGQMSE